MKNSLFFACLLVFFVLQLAEAQKHESHTLKDINLADPTIFYHNNTYYLYGTVEGNTGAGFLVYTSTDLQHWEGPKGASDGFALKQGDAFGEVGFWAPQIFQYNNKFYMAYTANEHIAIATSDSPLGPFTNPAKTALEAPVKQIDPFIFIDTDGKKYLYHVRLQQGNRIFVAELNDDLLSIKEETLKECIYASQTWENTRKTNWPVTEGPNVMKHNGLYYLTYSANDFRNPDYAVGYATSKSPVGPWEKSDKSPFIVKTNMGISGTGHGDFLADKKGHLWYVLHTHQSDTAPKPRRTALVKVHFVKDKAKGTEHLEADKESFHFLKIKSQ